MLPPQAAPPRAPHGRPRQGSPVAAIRTGDQRVWGRPALRSMLTWERPESLRGTAPATTRIVWDIVPWSVPGCRGGDKDGGCASGAGGGGRGRPVPRVRCPGLRFCPRIPTAPAPALGTRPSGALRPREVPLPPSPLSGETGLFLSVFRRLGFLPRTSRAVLCTSAVSGVSVEILACDLLSVLRVAGPSSLRRARVFVRFPRFFEVQLFFVV